VFLQTGCCLPPKKKERKKGCGALALSLILSFQQTDSNSKTHKTHDDMNLIGNNLRPQIIYMLSSLISHQSDAHVLLLMFKFISYKCVPLYLKSILFLIEPKFTPRQVVITLYSVYFLMFYINSVPHLDSLFIFAGIYQLQFSPLYDLS
jgi:hypothetical protein